MKAVMRLAVKYPLPRLASALLLAGLTLASRGALPALARPIDPLPAAAGATVGAPTPNGRAAPSVAAAGAASATTESAWVVLSVGKLSPQQARRLARDLPEWEEAIVAGSDELVVPADRAAAIRGRGHPVTPSGLAPAAAQSLPACYRSLDETYLWASEIARRNSWLVELRDIGDSHCKSVGGCRTPGGDRLAGRDLMVVRVTNGLTETKEGRLFIDGGIHAREIPGPEVVAGFVEHLIAAYGLDPQVTYLLDHRELYVGINSNPDGRDLVELGARRPYSGDPWSWRKNGNEDRRASCLWPPTGDNHYGVDLNRNHVFAWDAPGHGTDPCHVAFRGVRPASEIETRSYEAFVRSLFADRRGESPEDAAPIDTSGMLLNFHNATMPGTVLTPWGWTDARAPNAVGLYAIAERYAELSGGYRVAQSLYAVSGNTRDWAYGELGIPAYVVELQGRAFFTPCDDLADLVRDQVRPLLMALGIADRPYERILGPEIVEIDVADRIARGDPLEVSAKADATAAGMDVVAAVEATVARPGGFAAAVGVPAPRDAPGRGMALEADDGAFDEPMERARGSLDTSGWQVGVHYVVLRARSLGGHWGPASAVFVEVVAPTPAPLPSDTATPTATMTPTDTATPTATKTPTETAMPTATATPTETVAPTPSEAPPPTATAPPGGQALMPWLAR